MQISIPLTIPYKGQNILVTVEGDYEETYDPLGTGDSPREVSLDYYSVYTDENINIAEELDYPDLLQAVSKHIKGE